ncbi:MAG: hypothetical protein ChlgKO_13200 [Chlamydiales bacterium]
MEMFFQDKNLGPIRNIQVSIAGKERHYGGKVALYITFLDGNNNSSKVVYKPRSLLPEIYLEDFLETLNDKNPRPILNCTNHGYDSFIEGAHLCNEDQDLELELIKLIDKNDVITENIHLIYTLAKIGFEDTHQENFIINNKGYLFFIDAEIFCTNFSKNLSALLEEVEKKLEAEKKELFNINLNRFLKKLKSIPTRLIFCGTDNYLNLIYL